MKVFDGASGLLSKISQENVSSRVIFHLAVYFGFLTISKNLQETVNYLIVGVSL